MIDESGFLMRPLVRRSLAPRGKPLVLRYHSRHRRKVSVRGAVVMDARGRATAPRCRTHEDSYVDGKKSAEFLERLLAEFGGPLVVVWDRGNMHKGPHVRAVLEAHPRLSLEEFPAYCPDLDAVEWLWAWAKYVRLANFCPRDVKHLHSRVLNAIVEAQHNLALLQGFVRAAGLEVMEEPDRTIAA